MLQLIVDLQSQKDSSKAIRAFYLKNNRLISCKYILSIHPNSNALFYQIIRQTMLSFSSQTNSKKKFDEREWKKYSVPLFVHTHYNELGRGHYIIC